MSNEGRYGPDCEPPSMVLPAPSEPQGGVPGGSSSGINPNCVPLTQTAPLPRLATLPEAVSKLRGPAVDLKREGVKHDTQKPRLDLIPTEAIVEIAKVLTFGAIKYDEWNWARGMKWSRVIGAAERHIGAFKGGEDIDPETGLSHIAHAACNLMFLLFYEQHRRDNDDRRMSHGIPSINGEYDENENTQ